MGCGNNERMVGGRDTDLNDKLNKIGNPSGTFLSLLLYGGWWAPFRRSLWQILTKSSVNFGAWCIS